MSLQLNLSPNLQSQDNITAHIGSLSPPSRLFPGVRLYPYWPELRQGKEIHDAQILTYQSL